MLNKHLLLLIILTLNKNLNAESVFQQNSTFSGVIQTSGLSEKQKKKFQLTYSNHLLTDGYEQYIIESELDLSLYIGQFCKVFGRIVEKNNKSIFGCRVINIDRINIIEFQADFSKRDSLISVRTNYFKEQYHKNIPDTLQGKIIRTIRDNPDIFTDYAIVIDVPIEYSGSQVTDGVELISILTISYLDLNMVHKFEEHIRDDVPIKVMGFLFSGYHHKLTFSTIQIMK